MPRIEVQGSNGTYVRTDEPDLHRAGDWIAWALAHVETSQNMPARVTMYPIWIRQAEGPDLPDWPQSHSSQMLYPVMNLRGLIDRLQELEP
jgi:hypothetical protein